MHLVRAVQLALFLDADTAPFARAICDLLPSAGRARKRGTQAQQYIAKAQHTLQALLQQTAEVVETVAASHSDMQRHLAGKSAFVPLLQLPDALHTAACRVSASAARGALAFDLHSGPWRIAALQVLRNTPELQSLHLPNAQTAYCDPERVRVAMLATAPSLARLTQLTAVSLERATLDCLDVLLPHLAALPRLRELRVDACDFDTGGLELHGSVLGKGLAALTALTSLSLGVGSVDAAFAEHLSNCLLHLSALKTLRMPCCSFRPNAARDLTCHLPALQLLDLGTAYLVADDAPHLVPARGDSSVHHARGLGAAGIVRVLQQLPSLTLGAFALSDACSSDLLVAVAAAPRLTSLKLARAGRKETLQLCATGIEEFRRFCCALQNVHCLQLGSAGIDDKRMTLLASHAAAFTKLNALQLSGCAVSGQSMVALLESMSRLSSLTELELGIVGAADGLQRVNTLPQLQQLTLRADCWHLEAALEVADALRSLHRLKGVCVGGKMHDDVAAAVLRGLRCARQLRSLQLLCFECDSAVAQAFRSELSSLVALEVISLRRGHFAGDALPVLSGHVRRCPRLRCLDISSAQLCDGDVDAIIAAVEGLTGLTTLNLALNRFTRPGADRLAAGLAPVAEQLRPVRVPEAGLPARNAAEQPVLDAVGIDLALILRIAGVRTYQQLTFDDFGYPVITSGDPGWFVADDGSVSGSETGSDEGMWIADGWDGLVHSPTGSAEEAHPWLPEAWW